MAMADSDFIFSFVFIGSLSIWFMIGLIHRISMADGNMTSKCRKTLPGIRRKCRLAWRRGFLTRIGTICLYSLWEGLNVQVSISGRGRSEMTQDSVAAPFQFRLIFRKWRNP